MANIRAATASGKKSGATKVVSKAKKAAPKPGEKRPPTASGRETLGKRAATAKVQEDTRSTVTPAERQRMISEAAYLRAETRGFMGGDPTDDWLRAEAEIDKILSRT